MVDAICWRVPTRHYPCTWNVANMNIRRLVEALGTGRIVSEAISQSGSFSVDTVANSIINMITTACEVSRGVLAVSSLLCTMYVLYEVEGYPQGLRYKLVT